MKLEFYRQHKSPIGTKKTSSYSKVGRSLISVWPNNVIRLDEINVPVSYGDIFFCVRNAV